MSYLLAISGSPHPASANSRLLLALDKLTKNTLVTAPDISLLPVFQPSLDRAPWPASVIAWREALAGARGAVITTPAYLHNIPGVLKNALDWLASSGEFDEKPTLVFTFTPGPPRGDRARQSLLWSLAALNARVVAETALYQATVTFGENGDIADGPEREMLVEALNLLGA